VESQTHVRSNCNRTEKRCRVGCHFWHSQFSQSAIEQRGHSQKDVGLCTRSDSAATSIATTFRHSHSFSAQRSGQFRSERSGPSRTAKEMQGTLEAVPSERRLLSNCLPDVGHDWSAVLSLLNGRESCPCVSQSDESHSCVASLYCALPSELACVSTLCATLKMLDRIGFISHTSWEPWHSRDAFAPPELECQRGCALARFGMQATRRSFGMHRSDSVGAVVHGTVI
jgi:hypothetical protein